MALSLATWECSGGFVWRMMRGDSSRSYKARDGHRRLEACATGVLDSTSRNPTERNAVNMPGSADAVEAS